MPFYWTLQLPLSILYVAPSHQIFFWINNPIYDGISFSYFFNLIRFVFLCMHTSWYNKELSKANQNVFGSDNIHRFFLSRKLLFPLLSRMCNLMYFAFCMENETICLHQKWMFWKVLLVWCCSLSDGKVVSFSFLVLHSVFLFQLCIPDDYLALRFPIERFSFFLLGYLV